MDGRPKGFVLPNASLSIRMGQQSFTSSSSGECFICSKALKRCVTPLIQEALSKAGKCKKRGSDSVRRTWKYFIYRKLKKECIVRLKNYQRRI